MLTALLERLLHSRRPPPEPVADVADVAEPVAAAPGPAIAWPASRLSLAEALWGEGFTWPGGVPEIRRLMAPFGLTAAHSVLIVGVGPGGPARAAAADYGAWVTGAESDPQLLEIARRRIQRAGAALAKRANIIDWSPEHPSFPRRAFHHALMIDVLGQQDPIATLAATASAVKPGGQVILIQGEPADGRLGEMIQRTLKALGADVRLRDDESDRHSRLILQGWRNYVRTLRELRPTPAEAEALVAEASRWLQRVRLLRDGRLKLIRTAAIVGLGPDAA